MNPPTPKSTSIAVELDLRQQKKPFITGILVPIMPNLPFQQVGSCDIRPAVNKQRVMDIDRKQAAYWIESSDLPSQLTINYEVSLHSEVQHVRDTVFSNGVTEAWIDALGYRLERLKITKNQPTNTQVVLAQIIAFICDKFSYLSRSSTGELPDLTCDIVTGNCIDINNAFMTLLSKAGIEHCYFSGVFAQQDKTKAESGWHCWVATRCEGVIQYWDIAQHLKAGVSPIAAGLNPVGGVRAATSQGINLRFIVDGCHYHLSKFPFPTLLKADGTTELLLPSVTFEHKELSYG